TWTVNDPPTLGAIGDQTTAEDTPLVVPVSVGDLQTAAADLTVSASADNATLFPDGSLVVTGAGATRTLTATPARDQNGPAMVTIVVSDGMLSISETFQVTVTPVDDPPTITAVYPQTTIEGHPVGPIAITIGDVDSPIDQLTLRGTS